MSTTLEKTKLYTNGSSYKDSYKNSLLCNNHKILPCPKWQTLEPLWFLFLLTVESSVLCLEGDVQDVCQ